MVRNDKATTAETLAVRAVIALTEELGRPPSVREVARSLGVSNIYDTLEQCRRKGFIGDGKVVTITRMRVTAKGRRLV